MEHELDDRNNEVDYALQQEYILLLAERTTILYMYVDHFSCICSYGS